MKKLALIGPSEITRRFMRAHELAGFKGKVDIKEINSIHEARGTIFDYFVLLHDCHKAVGYADIMERMYRYNAIEITDIKTIL